MSTIDRATATPTEDLAELEQTIRNLIRGVRDPEAMDRAAKEMDEGREEIRRRLGELDIAAELTERDE